MSRTVRTGFDKLVDAHHMWMIYVRRDMRYPCDCYNPETLESDFICTECYGTNYKVSLHKVKARKMIAGRVQRLGRAAETTQPGILGEYDAVVYLKRCVYPKQSDRILIVEWDRPLSQVPILGKPIRLKEIYRIGVAKDDTEDEVSFFTTYCENLIFDFNLMEQQLRAEPLVPVLDNNA